MDDSKDHAMESPIKWNSLTSAEQDQIETAFSYAGLARDIQNRDKTHKSNLTPQMIYRYGQGLMALTKDIRAALLANPGLNRDFRYIRDQAAKVQFSRVAAAASPEGVTDRDLPDGTRISLVPSKRSHDLSILTITLVKPQTLRLIEVITPDNQTLDQHFPVDADDEPLMLYQLMLNRTADQDWLEAYSHPASRIQLL